MTTSSREEKGIITSMQQLVEYIASFDPGFASRIEGASPSEIERFERAAGGPFPPDYRAFLELMGRRDDAIVVSDDVVTSAETLADFYTESIHTGENEVPDDCISFAISGLSIEQLFLERKPPHRVFQVGDGEKGDFWAASFRGFLYQQGFKRADRRFRTLSLFSTDNAPRHSRALQLLEDLGLERLWFSDDVTLCYESPDDKILVQQIAGRHVHVQLSCRRFLRRWRLALLFARALHLPLMPQPH
ncbi:MAG TPA: SMI1/KNR4 family protein [Thermoanaerobaculia bacterium]